MRSQFTHDVFVSFAKEDEVQVRRIYDAIRACGLRPFWAGSLRPACEEFPKQLEDALTGSQHFLLYCSEASAKSEWVRKEWTPFWNSYHNSDPANRRFYVYLAPGCPAEAVPLFLQEIDRPASLDELLSEIVSASIEALESELKHERLKLGEARQYYRRNRFWDRIADVPLGEKREVHILTCGRGVSHADDTSRGIGGRTNIDMWDYQTVLDITHFFSSSYPNTTVKIEDPVGKLHGRDLEDPALMWQQLDRRRRMLENKNCVIVGSPDVSDFSEMVLAEIHGIPPYAKTRVKENGFVIIKGEKLMPGSFYWKKQESEQEGVALIKGPGDYRYFARALPSEDGRGGKMHGILVAAKNPFCRPGTDAWIIILSGFSGVATNGIAKLLTHPHEGFMAEFFKLDGEYTDLNASIEALIEVEYVLESDSADSDTRHISNVRFEHLVEI